MQDARVGRALSFFKGGDTERFIFHIKVFNHHSNDVLKVFEV